MDWAAAFGQTDAVKWLSENRTEGCTKDAMGETCCTFGGREEGGSQITA